MRRLWWWFWLVAALAAVAVTLRATRPCDDPATTVILVRHAEKEGGDDPALTPDGRAGAAELARVVGPSRPAALFATELRRTQETVAPWPAISASPSR